MTVFRRIWCGPHCRLKSGAKSSYDDSETSEKYVPERVPHVACSCTSEINDRSLQNCIQPTIHTHNRVSGKLTPDKKDRDAWWAFVSGRPESEWNPPKKPKGNKSNRQAREQRYGTGMRAFSEQADLATEGIIVGATRDLNDSEIQGSIPPAPAPAPAPDAAEVKARPDVPFAREPTPTLVQNIDHVRLSIFSRPSLTYDCAF